MVMANEIECISLDIKGDASDILTEDHESRVIIEGLENTMRAKLCKDSPWSGKSCIFRVPDLLRRHKPEAYGPNIVSIGPFHRGGKKFQPIDDMKQWYLHNLLSRMSISLKTLIQGIDNVIEFEKRARAFYSEPVNLSRDEFIEMLILDGCFLVELFWKFHCQSFNKLLKKNLVPTLVLNVDEDPIINNDCMIQYIFDDLLLLENQLPWFVVESLYNLTLHTYLNYPLNTIVLASFCSQPSLRCMLEFYVNHRSHDADADDGQDLDFDADRDSDDPVEFDGEDDNGCEVLHILDLVRTAATFRLEKLISTTGSKVNLNPLPAITLSKAGIIFRKSTDDSGIMEIKFEDGVFSIPQLYIAHSTEPLLRNLIAFEQCCPGRSHKVTSYAALMNSLIASSKDMEFLCTKGIISCWFSSKNGFQIFNKLQHDTILNGFCYGALCTEMINYYNVSWNRWLETLKRDYLCNPWKVTSLVAAFILLVLTLLQTTYTIQQYYSPRQ